MVSRNGEKLEIFREFFYIVFQKNAKFGEKNLQNTKENFRESFRFFKPYSVHNSSWDR